MKKRPLHRGLSLVECVIATLLVSTVLVAAMQVAAVSATYQARSAQRATAQFLARALTSDISQLAYQDPVNTPVAFGRELGETAASKVNYNDVDDFNGWSESPPQDRSGVVMAGMTNYTRSVAVAWVNPANFSQVMGAESGVKRITITVSLGKAVIYTKVFVRTNAPTS